MVAAADLAVVPCDVRAYTLALGLLFRAWRGKNLKGGFDEGDVFILEFLYHGFGSRKPVETKVCNKCKKPSFPVYRLLDVYVCKACITEFIASRTTVTLTEDPLL